MNTSVINYIITTPYMIYSVIAIVISIASLILYLVLGKEKWLQKVAFWNQPLFVLFFALWFSESSQSDKVFTDFTLLYFYPVFVSFTVAQLYWEKRKNKK